MIALKAASRAAIAAAATVVLAGCITVFPESKPTQMYRFGAPAAVADRPQAGPEAGPVGVLKPASNFARAVGGDHILSVTGAEAAYIADARWVAPASALFDEAIAQAFDASPGRVRLVARGEAARTDYVMRLDVRNFEAVYESGPRSAPTVVVRARAVLTRTRDRSLIDERVFEVRVKAPGNRIGAIVQTFDAAVAEVLSQLVAWSSEKAIPVAP